MQTRFSVNCSRVLAKGIKEQDLAHRHGNVTSSSDDVIQHVSTLLMTESRNTPYGFSGTKYVLVVHC
jgi:hypothetical protein